MTHFLQFFTNGIIDGSSIGLLAASFGLILAVTQRFHVAYVASYVLAVYAGIWAATDLHLMIGLCVVIGLVAATLLGVLLERFVYRPVAQYAQRRGGDPLIPVFIASLGATIVVQNLISVHFNTNPLPFSVIQPTGVTLGGVHITNFDIISVVLAWLLIAGLAWFLRYTRRGRWIGATRVNAELAATVGIKTGRIYLVVFAIGSALAGVLGMFESTNVAASPTMGFNFVFYGFLVAFLAGMGRSPVRMAVVGLIIGEVSDLSGLWISSAWAPLVVFSILMIYLVVKALQTQFPSLRLTSLRRFAIRG